ncbi:cobalamin biosynthesis protein CobY [Haloglomus irregulare]|jgi:adenosylcobinamide-phosphate guanylyltransferase|uniref:Cobalamin biosynthesis protein CobY n=1 Tax=Haloglomus irregulare TaxID=2234134 RepID=A0A554MWC8_9EURY|nr:cobalamin biosynthesis protein CobY [Haloglomus irregulare]
MDALIMCGGRGTRLDTEAEKPLHEVAGRPMLDRVREALSTAETVDRVHLVTSPQAPRTARHVAETARDHESTVAAPGEGYVADLGRALHAARVTTPVLTVAADLPLLAADAVDTVGAHFAALDPEPGGPPPSLTVCVPTALKRVLGVSADTTRVHEGRELAPTGVNVVGAVAGESDETDTAPEHDERLYVTYDARLAVNVNRLADVAVAERLAGGAR